MTQVWVEFAEHIKPDKVASMSGTLMSCGDVTHGPDDRTFLVEIRRPASLAYLEETLLGWDRYGFVKWRRIEIPE